VDERGLLASWLDEERAPFAGWDFSHISGRLIEQSPPWSYEELARELMRGAGSLLDLGTGGGEVLSRLRDAFPRRIAATEAYAPNVDVARARLSPLGVDVVPYQATETRAPLPFADTSFDLILSRHEAFEPVEIARVLTPGGVFLTQQVDGRSLAELLRLFDASPQWPHVTLEPLSGGLRTAGLVIEDGREWWGRMVVRDVGALVYFLAVVPWEVPGFTVAKFERVLVDLHRRIERDGTIEFPMGRFLIRARKRSAPAPAPYS
jgi:SAM-dependent methyltransferase